MRLKILWPGKTKNEAFRTLQEYYLTKIRRMTSCELLETREARGLEDRHIKKILEIEAKGLAKCCEGDYIICLSDQGQEMNSRDFARFLEKAAGPSRPVTFIVGGFSGLAEKLIRRADVLLSLSRMTFSHELSRIVLLEQIFRSLTILKGTHYAK